jgi:hypothetical protein
MAGIIFLSENYTDDANLSLSLGTANAQFPLTNIKNNTTVKKFRSIENTVKIVIDMQQTRNIDSVALHGDSTQTLGLTVASIKFSLTTDFSSFTAIPITLSAEHGFGYYLAPAMLSYRYAELSLTGNGSFCELSNIFIGSKINLEQNSLSIGSFAYGHRDRSTVTGNDYGQKFVNKRNVVKYVAGDLENCTKDEQEQLDDMFIRHQRSLPLWMIVDKDSEGMNGGAYKLAIYGYIEDSPDWKAVGGRHYNARIRLDQVV